MLVALLVEGERTDAEPESYSPHISDAQWSRARNQVSVTVKARGIIQHPYTGLRILMRHYRGHGPGKHRVPAGKRCVDHGMTQKVPMPIAFARTLSCSDELHRRVNQKRVDQGLQFQFAGFSGVRMVDQDWKQELSETTKRFSRCAGKRPSLTLLQFFAERRKVV
jgi:hypothetical protein